MEPEYWANITRWYDEDGEPRRDTVPTDAEVDAELARLAPDVAEFDARERAKEREAA